jgi:hypothetical protein
LELVAKEMQGENLQSASALYVPLLHYPEKTATRQPIPSGLRPQQSAACGCNKSAMKDEQRQLSTTDASQSGDSSLFVIVRPLSWLFAFIPAESSLFACNMTGSSGIL